MQLIKLLYYSTFLTLNSLAGDALALEDVQERRREELTSELLSDYIQGLRLDPKLNGILKPLFNAKNNDNSPYALGIQGLFPTEIILLFLFTYLNGAHPEDFDITNQSACPTDETDRKYGVELIMTSETGYQDFFQAQSIIAGVEGVSAEAPGLCTTTVFSHEGTKQSMASLPILQTSGEVFRGNDLGLFRINMRIFEYCYDLLPEAEHDFCGIVLSMSNDNHLNIRPRLDELWGDDNAPGSIFTTSGPRWTKQDFLDSATEFFQGRTDLDLPGDAEFWTIKELHKQALGITLSDSQVQAFLELQGASLFLGISPPSLVDMLAASIGTSVAAVNAGLASFVSLYESVLPSIFQEEFDEVDLTKTAMTLLDSFLFAGGASVPSTIKNGLAAYYEGLTPKGRFSMTNPMDLGVLVLETARSYPPVLGFAYIDNVTGRRYASVPGMSGFDRSIWGGDADKFRIRGDLSYYHARTLNWADSALPVDGIPGSNHVCPARSMSYSMVVAFWEALNAEQWCVDSATPIVKESGPTFFSDFKILKCSENI